ncbi:hypothetical protein DL767_003382 [Monosporascus sp. MG133]|nr:hypothetical protein DL767_003382 [Monosporascus sp. MG133]
MEMDLKAVRNPSIFEYVARNATADPEFRERVWSVPPEAMSWLSLPLEQRPGTWARWRDSVSLDYWIPLRLKFAAPLVHNDTTQGQVLAEQFTEETRATSILTDIYGLERMVAAGVPQGEDITAASWCFWMAKLMDVRKAIVDRFGRYPYCNAIQGLESTEDEKRWLEETNHFGEAPPDVARRVRPVGGRRSGKLDLGGRGASSRNPYLSKS